MRQKKAALSEEMVKAQVGKEETEERSLLLQALDKKQSHKKQLAQELEQYKSCDPARLKELREYKGRLCLTF